MKTVFGLEAARTVLARPPSTEFMEPSPAAQQKIAEIFGERITPAEAVARILEDVRVRGDEALFHYSEKIDGVRLSSLRVPGERIAGACRAVSPDLTRALELAAERIRSFHAMQKDRTSLQFESEGLGLLARPLDRVGTYVPGGRAPYPSTVLMTAIPAKVAGVEQVIMATPPSKEGDVADTTLAAAHIAGVDSVFQIGGAQAIGAMAFGTHSVPAVDKICGPGNIFVSLAKKQVYGTVGVDGVYGPTETVILADDSASPVLCAADLLAQAEHDEMATAVFITTSPRLADEVNEEVHRQLSGLERRDIARESLDRTGALVVLSDFNEAIEVVNTYAPEHVCLHMKDARSFAHRIRHAGGIFIDSPEALGDYTAGPSHVMPTGSAARFNSSLSVLDFLKVSTVVDLGDDAMRALGPAAAAIARAEGLTAHALAIEKRLAK